MDPDALQALIEQMEAHVTSQKQTMPVPQTFQLVAPPPVPEVDEKIEFSDEEMAIIEGFASDYASSPELATPEGSVSTPAATTATATTSTAAPTQAPTRQAPQPAQGLRMVYNNKSFVPRPTLPILPPAPESPIISFEDSMSTTLGPELSSPQLLGELTFESFIDTSAFPEDEYLYEPPSILDVPPSAASSSNPILGWSASSSASYMTPPPANIDPSLLPGGVFEPAQSGIGYSPIMGYSPTTKTTPLSFDGLSIVADPSSAASSSTFAMASTSTSAMASGSFSASTSTPTATVAPPLSTGLPPLPTGLPPLRTAVPPLGSAPAPSTPNGPGFSFAYYDGDTDLYNAAPSTRTDAPLPTPNTDPENTPTHVFAYGPSATPKRGKGKTPKTPAPTPATPATPKRRRRAAVPAPPSGGFTFVLYTADDAEMLSAGVAPSGGRGKGKSSPSKRSADVMEAPPTPTKTRGPGKMLQSSRKGKGRA